MQNSSFGAQSPLLSEKFRRFESDAGTRGGGEAGRAGRPPGTERTQRTGVL
ncbi:hypothetical protein CLV54_0035 [Compostimonas suwonensis]|uniref:Uncharacterized protein n=1 Tax=Compostimonas suwonensis TaxID=1048394 RepID=A0A2M9C391_9MICO|nr:hypothetical protein CLV54_0035 [Compostimonas suwonensis]